MKKHVTSIHKGKNHFKCDRCLTKFYKQRNLKELIESVHEGKQQKLECEICFEKFISKPGLKGHVASIHEVKDLLNETCVMQNFNKKNI